MGLTKKETDVKKSMKKTVLLLFGLVLAMCMFCGCGAKTSYDADGNAAITSKWRIREFTVKGTTTKIYEQPFWLQIIAAGDNPRFSCSDGINCEFTNLGKSHSGTVSFEDGVYKISFGEASNALTGVITGNLLEITNDKGTLSLVFEAR